MSTAIDLVFYYIGGGGLLCLLLLVCWVLAAVCELVTYLAE